MSDPSPPTDPRSNAGYSSFERSQSLPPHAPATVPPPIGGFASPRVIPNVAPPRDAVPSVDGEPKQRWKNDFEPIQERLPRPEIDAAEPKISDSPSAETREDLENEEGSHRSGHGVPAWLASLIIHTLLLVILVLVKVGAGAGIKNSLFITLSDAPAETVELIQMPSDPVELEVSGESSASTPNEPSNAATSQPATPMAITIRSPLDTSESMAVNLSDSISALVSSDGNQTSLQPLPAGGVYRRDATSRAELGAKFGATPESEDAVEAALKWLAAHQKTDGSWSFDLSQQPCGGRCSHSQQSVAESARPATAATGLALLAFLGAGYSHHEGLYADNVRRGLYFLREASRESQFGLDLQSGSMYGHGIAMLAISEAMAMTRYQGKTDSDLFSLTQRGSYFTTAAQHSQGGWRYVPGSPGDMTVTAWQVLSLISAQHGGVVLPTNTLSRSEEFVRRLSKQNAYEFGYQTTTPEPTTTAVGLCLLLYLGQSPRETLFGNSLDRMTKRGPRRTDVYHDYYATLALHHARHRDWASWHVPLRDHLVKTQATEGHEAGSWHFADRHGDVGGRLYTTAMAAMILEVYYRYLPLYQTRDEFKLD